MIHPSRNVPSDQPIFIRVAKKACEITNRITQIAKAFFTSLVEFFLSPFRSSPVITPHVESSAPIAFDHFHVEDEPEDNYEYALEVDAGEHPGEEFQDAVENEAALSAAPPHLLTGADVDAPPVDEDQEHESEVGSDLDDTADDVATSSGLPVFPAPAADLPSLAPLPLETEAQKKDRVEKALMMPQVKIDALKGFLRAGASCNYIGTLAVELGKYARGGNGAPFEDIVYFIQQNHDLHIHIQEIEKIISGAWLKDAIVKVINRFTPKLEDQLKRFKSDRANTTPYTVIQQNEDGTSSEVTQYTTSTLKERFELCEINEAKIRAFYTAFENKDSKNCFQLLFPRINFN